MNKYTTNGKLVLGLCNYCDTVILERGLAVYSQQDSTINEY